MAYITYRDTLRRVPAGESTRIKADLAGMNYRSHTFGDTAWSAPLAVLETALVVTTLGFFGLMLDSAIAGVF